MSMKLFLYHKQYIMMLIQLRQGASKIHLSSKQQGIIQFKGKNHML